MKLPNGFGSVYKLSGKRRNPWAARKTIGWKDDYEKQTSYPIYKFIGYFPNKKEAIQALSKYNENPYEIDTDTITIKDLYYRWTKQYFETVSDSSINATKTSWKTLEKLQNYKIKDLKLDHYQKLFDDSGKHTPTLKRIKVTLGLMYDYAVKHELINKDKRDMISYIDTSKGGNPNSLKRSNFTSQEIKILWDNVSEDRVKMILILIYTGLRISEFLGLKKEDIHLTKRYFSITKSKTESGIRTVPIADKISPLVEYLLDNNQGEYLITNQKSKPLSYRTYYDYYWKPILSELNISHRIHDTRHTFVSLMASNNIDERIIKRIVGHKGFGVTQTVYTHFAIKDLIGAVNKI